MLKGAARASQNRDDLASHDQRRERHGPRVQPFAEHDQVGCRAEALEGEPTSRPPHAAEDLVGDPEHAMAATGCGDPRPVLRRRHDGSRGGAPHRLGEEGGDAVGSLAHDLRLDRLAGRRRVPGPSQRVGGRESRKGQQERLVELPIVLPPGERQRGERVAVVGGHSRDHLPPFGATDLHLILPGELDRRLDRLGAAREEVDMTELRRQTSDQLGGQILRGARGELGAIDVAEGTDLGRDGVGDFVEVVA